METMKLAIDYGIIGMLIVMSIIAVGIAIERFSFIRRFDLNEAAKSLKTREELEIELTKGFILSPLLAVMRLTLVCSEQCSQ